MLSYKRFSYKNKTALIRIDMDVPLKRGRILDDARLRASLPTIEFVLANKGRVVLLGHIGRPKGKIVQELRVDPVARFYARMLSLKPVIMRDFGHLPDADLVVFENLRFWEGEEANSSLFARKLAAMGDVYINDAFAVAHRRHASVDKITSYLPSAAGESFLSEVKYLRSVVNKPARPYVAILGAAKVSDKIKLLNSLLKKVDKLLIGGAVVFTFLKSLNIEIGKSLCEDSMLDEAAKLLKKYHSKIILPVDFVVADNPHNPLKIEIVDKIPDDMMGLDIGRKSIELFKLELKYAKTVVWNGPLGMYENRRFAHGTRAIASYLASLRAKTIVGGGDTGAALRKMKLANKMTHVSIAGGAFLKYLEGKTLPAIKALER